MSDADKPLTFEEIMQRKGAEVPQWRKDQQEQVKQAEANLTDEQRAEKKRLEDEKLRLQTEPHTPGSRTELRPDEGGSQQVQDTTKVESEQEADAHGTHGRHGKKGRHE